jgi:hypothetical protein
MLEQCLCVGGEQQPGRKALEVDGAVRGSTDPRAGTGPGRRRRRRLRAHHAREPARRPTPPRRPATARAAALGLALSFTTWQHLVRREQLDDDATVVEILTRAVASAG